MLILIRWALQLLRSILETGVPCLQVSSSDGLLSNGKIVFIKIRHFAVDTRTPFLINGPAISSGPLEQIFSYALILHVRP